MESVEKWKFSALNEHRWVISQHCGCQTLSQPSPAAFAILARTIPLTMLNQLFIEVAFRSWSLDLLAAKPVQSWWGNIAKVVWIWISFHFLLGTYSMAVGEYLLHWGCRISELQMSSSINAQLAPQHGFFVHLGVCLLLMESSKSNYIEFTINKIKENDWIAFKKLLNFKTN